MKFYCQLFFSALISLMLLVPVSGLTQGAVIESLNAKMLAKQANTVSLLMEKTNTFSQSKYSSLVDQELLDKASFFDINALGVNNLKVNDMDLITFSINLPEVGMVEIGLYRQNIFTEDLVINSNQGTMSNKTAKKILCYRGGVLNYPNSLVTITIMENEISGLISIGNNNYNLGKIKGTDTHILYHEKDLNLAHDFVCSTVDDELKDPKPIGAINPNKTTQCVRVRVEVDNGLANQLGGLNASVNYVASLYNEVLTLYDNDNISVNVSEVYVWQGSSPYSGDSDGILDQMSNTSPNADLTTLLSNQGSGGIAWLSGLCSVSNATNFNSIYGSYASVPTYSWDVEVVAHEMGHNLSSPHTHACAWNGNNTAIDGCGPNAGYSEGCDGANPAGGGTIMSYCHLTSVGINFTLGFGPQPAQRIRNYVDASNCLGSVCVAADPTCDDGILNGTETAVDCGNVECGPCPTCDDGIQNGLETDIDCGGNLCEPCDCFDNPVLLTIVLDQYPGETSWNILDADGGIVFNGGTYSGEPDYSTYTVPMCLTTGCYTLNFFDSYGDGICCSYGEGSYVLSDSNGNALVTGGEFDSEETTPFCIEGTSAEVELVLKAILEGPYDQETDLMKDDLRSGNMIPLQQPYSSLGYEVPAVSIGLLQLGIAGSEAIVDWILVELRDGNNPSSVLATQAAILRRSGTIVAPDGTNLTFDIGTGVDFCVALRHRNHFGIRTADVFTSGGTFIIDFSDMTLPTFGTNSMNVVNGKHVMISGDANGDGQVNSIDKNSFWRIQNSQTFDYFIFGADYNMDGIVNSFDKNILWRVNNSKFQQLD